MATDPSEQPVDADHRLDGAHCPGAGDTPSMDAGTAADGAAQGRLVPTVGAFALGLALLVGAIAGVGSFTFGYGEGAAYLSSDPTACTNCHIMQGHFDTWEASAHRHVAVCNDCHLPHDPVGKWVTKADNGFFHSLAFTTGGFHEPIQIKARNRRVTQAACIDCHSETVHNMFPAQAGEDMLSCIHCHSDAGHMGR